MKVTSGRTLGISQFARHQWQLRLTAKMAPFGRTQVSGMEKAGGLLRQSGGPARILGCGSLGGSLGGTQLTRHQWQLQTWHQWQLQLPARTRKTRAGWIDPARLSICAMVHNMKSECQSKWQGQWENTCQQLEFAALSQIA